MSSPGEVTFTGKPTDIDLVAAEAMFRFILNEDDYSEDSQKIAYFLSKCRGPALTWGARYLDMNPGLTAETYAAFLTVVKETFGYDSRQSAAIARAQLSSIQQRGTLIEFISEFDDACGRADIHGDEAKITMLLSKLKPRYQQIIAASGVIPETYSRLRVKLCNISAMEGQATDLPSNQVRQPRHTRKNRHRAEGPRIKIEAKN